MQIEEGKYYRTRDGRKVGPMSRCGLASWPWGDGRDDGVWDDYCRDDGSTHTGSSHIEQANDLIAEWTDGPVRTETVKRIVEGRYGLVDIDTHKDQLVVSINPSMGWNASAEDLRAAAVVLNQIADAL